MPKGTKAQRAGKLSGRRLVYVSWLESNPSKLAWKDNFFERVESETRSLDSFELPLQTGHERAGSVKNEWRRALVGGKATGARGVHLTDIVGVVTNAYIKANASRGDEPAAGELAEIIDLIRKDKRDRVRVWLAPVDHPTWKNYRIRDIVLADPDGTHRSWLVRLREDARFLWPEEGPRCFDEINAAVATIIDAIDDDQR
jgi:hypothetical protein